MGLSGVDQSNLSLYRLVKGGEYGLNLSLTDLYGSEIEVPNLGTIIKTIFNKKPIRIKVKGRSEQLINKLLMVQKYVDDEIEKEVKKAKRNI